MTGSPTPQTTPPRFSTSDSAWLIVAALLVSIGVLLAVIAPLITANPTGIPGGILTVAAGSAIAVLVLRRKRS